MGKGFQKGLMDGKMGSLGIGSWMQYKEEDGYFFSLLLGFIR